MTSKSEQPTEKNLARVAAILASGNRKQIKPAVCQDICRAYLKLLGERETEKSKPEQCREAEIDEKGLRRKCIAVLRNNDGRKLDDWVLDAALGLELSRAVLALLDERANDHYRKLYVQGLEDWRQLRADHDKLLNERKEVWLPLLEAARHAATAIEGQGDVDNDELVETLDMLERAIKAARERVRRE